MKFSPSFLRGSAVGAILSIGVLAAVPALAFRGDPAARGPNFSPERHEQMQQALQNRDYAAWNALMQQDSRTPRVLDMVTEETFDTFARMHELMVQGDREGADALREELGLPSHERMHMRGEDGCCSTNMMMNGKGPAMRQGHDMGKGRFMSDLTVEQRTELHDAIQSCKDGSDDRIAIQRCRMDILEQYRQ